MFLCSRRLPTDSTSKNFVTKALYMHLDVTAITISKEEEEAILSKPFKFTLVREFSNCKSSMIKV